MVELRRRHLLCLSFVLLFLVSLLFYPKTESHVYADSSETLFQDDFEGGEIENWDIHIPPDAPPGSIAAVELDDGNHVLSLEGNVWADAGNFTWTDYTLQVKFKALLGILVHEDPRGGIQINFRMSWEPFSRYILTFNGYHLNLMKEYPVGTFSSLTQVEEGLNLNTWYTLKIVLVGNNISVYVNDVLRLNCVDDKNPLLSGRIGLLTSRQSLPKCHVHFDDVKVSTTQAPQRISTSLSCQLSSRSIDEGSSITVSGTLTSLGKPLGYVEIGIAFWTGPGQSPTETWPFTVRTNIEGKFTYTWKPPHPGDYGVKVVWEGDAKYQFSAWSDNLNVKTLPGPLPFALPPPIILIPALGIVVIVAVIAAARRKPKVPVAVPVPPRPPSSVEVRVLKVKRALEELEKLHRQEEVSNRVYKELKREYELELRALERELGRRI